MDRKIQEELFYLLMFIDDYIETCVYNVLGDSKTDPQYSAVTTSNLIKCYVNVMNALGEELPYSDVKSYFKENLFSAQEYAEFEQSHSKESEYYVGKIY